jgi:hypothetical protein
VFESKHNDRLAEIARDPSSIGTLSREVAKAAWIEASAITTRLLAVWASPDDSRDEILNVHGAAALLRVSESFIYENAKFMKRAAFKVGGAWRFHSKFLIEDGKALRDRADNEPISNRRASARRADRRLRAGGAS